jgi:uroporphyrinogen-III synthase
MLLFYSRNLNQATKLASFCEEKGFRLIAQSMISFEAVDFSLPDQKFDVVFFTSPRSVDFFLAKAEIQAYQKVACIGTQTQKHLEKLGLTVAFCGENSTEPDEVAKQFKLWLKEQTVLFPISNQSQRSISRILPERLYQELIVYQTVQKTFSLSETPNVLIFSSPSNARAFLSSNHISSSQKVACFGRTTYHFLQERKINASILINPTEEAVLTFIETLESN